MVKKEEKKAPVASAEQDQLQEILSSPYLPWAIGAALIAFLVIVPLTVKDGGQPTPLMAKAAAEMPPIPTAPPVSQILKKSPQTVKEVPLPRYCVQTPPCPPMPGGEVVRAAPVPKYKVQYPAWPPVPKAQK